jgi:hypothetical protein
VFLGISISVPLRLPSLFLLCSSTRRAAAAPAGHVSCTAPLRCSAPSHVPPQPNATAPPSRAGLSPPCHAAELSAEPPSAAARCCRKLISATSCFPANPTRHSPARRCLSSPRCLLLVPTLWQNQLELHRLKYASPLLRAPTCFKRYNPLACRVTSR